MSLQAESDAFAHVHVSVMCVKACKDGPSEHGSMSQLS